MNSLSLPTSRDDWRRMGRTTTFVLGRPRWLVFGAFVSILALTLFVAIERVVYVQTVILGGSFTLSERVRVLAQFYPLVGSSADPIRGVLLYVIAGVVGVTFSMFGYHLTNGGLDLSEGSGGVAGIVFATLGVGCPSCGVAVAASVASASSVATGLTVLPLNGVEFLLASLAVTVVSLHWLVEGMQSSDVEGCPVDL